MPHVRDLHSMSHHHHDPTLVAGLAAGDLTARELDEALALTRACADCARLHDDLVAIRQATASVPPPFPIAGRDFRLTPADAARLRPTSWRRFSEAISGVRAGLARPAGIGLATLGLV